MNKIATHDVELNFYYLHRRDAETLIEKTSQERSKLKSLYARHAILSVIFASEALINRVLNDFYIPRECDLSIKKLSIPEKWCIAPLTCAENTSLETFDKSREPFQSFAELMKIRNWLVHPKTGEVVDATTEGEIISLLETGQEVLWIDTIRGKAWPQTKMPVNPFELTEVHAQRALDILQKMTQELNRFLNQKLTNTWLNEINFVAKDKSSSQKVTIDSLWGGYAPD